jgi:hypothetical protein
MSRNLLKHNQFKILVIIIFTFVFTGISRVYANPSKPDISCRPALYFGGKLGNLKDMNEGAKYVVPGKKIILTKADSFLQSGGKYAFNVGYYVFAKPDKDAPSLPKFTNRLLINNKEVVNQHSVKFTSGRTAAGGAIEAIHTQVYLPQGESVVYLSLDADKTIDESAEDNNLHRFVVVVQP